MIRLAVRCRAEIADSVLADLLELAPGGVEEERGGDWVEYAIYGPPGEIPAVGELEAVAGAGLVEISSTEIPDDWADRWRDFHEPVSIGGGRLVVKPSWETAGELAAGPPGGLEVIVDPGQAFGTGAHATTRLCLELLLELADGGRGGPLVDLGTGSGVLAIAAAKLGFAPVRGFDSEAAAVAAAGANARSNGVEVAIERLNLRDEPPPVAPTIVANLTTPLLEVVIAGLPRVPEAMVLSGVLRSEAERVTAALAARGLRAREQRVEGEWVGLLAVGAVRS